MQSEAHNFLRRVPAFSAVPNDSLAHFAQHFSEKRYSKGSYICREGDFDPWLYIISSGQCQALKKHPQTDRDVWLRSLQTYDFIGLTSAFRPKPRSATVIAESEVIVYAISHQQFQEALLGRADHAEILRCLFDLFSENIRKKNRQVIESRKNESASGKYPVAVFDSKPYTQESFSRLGGEEFDFHHYDMRLTPETAPLAEGFAAVVGFVNDDLSEPTLRQLRDSGVGLIALRCAGFNNIDLGAAKALGLSITRVPAYSPHAVAEHSLALILALNRRIHKAYQRVREGNFRLDGLVGFDLFGQTVGILGTGKIGKCMVKILQGMGCNILCYDKFKDDEINKMDGVRYCQLDELLSKSRVISLYLPLNPETLHIIDEEAIKKMQDGVMLINTSRGALVETQALIDGLKSGKIGAAGLDVYEEESAYFFEDFSQKTINDDTLARLLTFNNVVVTSHQAFLTEQALENIAGTTLVSLREYFQGKRGSDLTFNIKG